MQVNNANELGLLQGPPLPETNSDSPGALGKGAFLRLLIAQLEHQDPLSPIENSEFTTQLAQFNTLEQIETMNVNLTALLASQESMSAFQASGLIGKEVQAQGNTTQVRQGEGSALQYRLSDNSAKVSINVYDERGNLVQTLEAINQPSGDQVVAWNGHNAQDAVVPDGTYTFTVSAIDNTGEAVGVDTFMQGRVEGVEFVGNRPLLLVGGNRIELSSIVSVTEAE